MKIYNINSADKQNRNRTSVHKDPVWLWDNSWDQIKIVKSHVWYKTEDRIKNMGFTEIILTSHILKENNKKIYTIKTLE